MCEDTIAVCLEGNPPAASANENWDKRSGRMISLRQWYSELEQKECQFKYSTGPTWQESHLEQIRRSWSPEYIQHRISLQIFSLLNISTAQKTFLLQMSLKCWNNKPYYLPRGLFIDNYKGSRKRSLAVYKHPRGPTKVIVKWLVLWPDDLQKDVWFSRAGCWALSKHLAAAHQHISGLVLMILPKIIPARRLHSTNKSGQKGLVGREDCFSSPASRCATPPSGNSAAPVYSGLLRDPL